MKISKDENGKLIIDGQGSLVIYKQLDGLYWFQLDGIKSEDVLIINSTITGSPMPDFTPKRSFWDIWFRLIKRN